MMNMPVSTFFEGFTVLQHILSASIIVAVGILVYLIFNYLFKKFHKLTKNDARLHVKFYKSVIDFLIIVAFVYIALNQFEVTKDFSKSFLQSGTLIIAILTFAAQKALANVISGFMLSRDKCFEVGHKIKVVSTSGSIIVEGVVTGMNARHTAIQQYDGNTDIVPNSVMDSSIIINTHYTADIGHFVEVEIAYKQDVDKALELFKQIVVDEPLTINDLATTNPLVNRMTQNGIVLKVLVKSETLSDCFVACSNIYRKILKEFEENNIAIPYQTVTVVTEDKNSDNK